jgi:hypothetical protein
MADSLIGLAFLWVLIGGSWLVDKALQWAERRTLDD